MIKWSVLSFQVQQQLQSMYEIPNRNMQIAQQIEQLQLRLQYLQQCYMNDCRGSAQRNEQPVSVMQRGSEVQVLLASWQEVIFWKFYFSIKEKKS